MDCILAQVAAKPAYRDIRRNLRNGVQRRNLKKGDSENRVPQLMAGCQATKRWLDPLYSEGTVSSTVKAFRQTKNQRTEAVANATSSRLDSALKQIAVNSTQESQAPRKEGVDYLDVDCNNATQAPCASLHQPVTCRTIED